MLEKDIENLIAKYPNEFFPNSGFTLVGQQVKLGKCFADIIFEDKYKRKIIVEVKRGILSRDAVGQVTEYYGLLKSQDYGQIIELILCANIIPKERTLFLETIGIECKELGINFINQVAEKVGYTFIDRLNKKDISKKEIVLPLAQNIWIFQANPERYDILNALADDAIGTEMHWLVNQHKKQIKLGDIVMIWLSGKEAGIYALTEIISDPDLLEEPEAEKKHWTGNEDKEGKKLRVKMRILNNMLNCPLLKEEIKNKPGLQNLSILNQPRGTNFIVTNEEWYIIKSLIT